MRLSCWSSMFNGIWPVSTNKRFNSAYLQIVPCMLEKDCNGNPIFTVPPCYAFQMNCPLGWFSLQVAMSVIGKKNFETVVKPSIPLCIITVGHNKLPKITKLGHHFFLKWDHRQCPIWVRFLRTWKGPELCDFFKKLEWLLWPNVKNNAVIFNWLWEICFTKVLGKYMGHSDFIKLHYTTL